MTAHYERLSYLDNSFLALESASTHMHVGAVVLLDAAPLSLPDGGVDVERIRRFVESKLHLIERYRQRLAWVPLERHPVWIDDDQFDIDFHVRHIAVPQPGTDAQLKELVGRLMSEQLDRSKPLWELNVVEGLEDGRFAIISKIHHSMIDGVAGVDLMAVLLNLEPTEEIEQIQPAEPRPAPNGTELFVRETSRRISSALATLRDVRALADDVADVAGEVVRRGKAVGASLSSGWLKPTGRTPINGDVGPNRRFEWLDMSLEEVKSVKRALGGTVNDVVLATVAGGVRRFLYDERGLNAADMGRLDYRVMAPVSVRSNERRGAMGNEVAMWLVTLPVGEGDPVRRFEAVRLETENLKQTDQALGAATLVRLSAGAPATLVSLGARLASNARPFNTTVTNVPGPQFPLYMLGSKLLATYPLVPLWQSHGVGVALFSYDGRVHWGFNGDYDLLYDLSEFAGAMEESFEELLEAAKNA